VFNHIKVDTASKGKNTGVALVPFVPPACKGQKNITGYLQKTSAVAGDKNCSLTLFLLPLPEVFVFTGELLNPACCIQEFLFARKEGMAVRTDVYRIILAGRRSLKGCATGTGYGYVVYFGVNPFFHPFTPQTF
jgi:hypothetical protein